MARSTIYTLLKKISKPGTRLKKGSSKFKSSDEKILKNYIHKIRGIINEFAEYIPEDINIEVSHHYGIS